MLNPGQKLESVIVLAALVVLMTVLPKAIELAENTVGASPTPPSATVSGLLGALVVTVSDVAGTAPATVGVSVSWMLQLELAASVVPHVPPEIEYGAATESGEIVIGDSREL